MYSAHKLGEYLLYKINTHIDTIKNVLLIIRFLGFSIEIT